MSSEVQSTLEQDITKSLQQRIVEIFVLSFSQEKYVPDTEYCMFFTGETDRFIIAVFRVKSIKV